MKTTIFQGTELKVSIMYDKNYMDLLMANGIEYNMDEISFFQPLLPDDVIAYNGYKINYLDENGKDVFVYCFITMTYDSHKCVSFISEKHLDSLYLLDLEQAMRLGKLVYEGHDDGLSQFSGFDFDQQIEISRLLDTYIDLGDDCTYEFYSLEEFPEGVSGKKVLPNGDGLNVFIIKINSTLAVNEQGSGWKILNEEEMKKIFGK